ncbi:MAG TPA: 3-phosphoshikimate 1-carboxyvinyltransferase [Gemmatimonadales bacterium]|nr:3-phosphoshikimate 1-carboxyvinyltransferase [Gemmatimonadales bacterium]
MHVSGSVTPPGDKSLSHRALMLAALAKGKSEITGILTGEDVKSTARVLRQLGAAVSPVREGTPVTIRSGRLTTPGSRLHCGNSGTTTRLLLGILAGEGIRATLTGDASLRRRPMRRVTDPLRAMGSRIEETEGGTLPASLRGGKIHGIDYRSPVASAQVKSALLLAGLTGGVAVTVREPMPSRDHTERMLRWLGEDASREPGVVGFRPSGNVLKGFSIAVPADPSSAAFLVAVAVLAEQGELRIQNVCVNPGRTGFLPVLARMGAAVDVVNVREVGPEPVADLLVRPAPLSGTTVTPAEVPALVDEVPILAVLASRASGETVFHGVGELRVKESDRLEMIARNLRSVGVLAEAHADDLHVRGTGQPPRGTVETARDHRLAMAFAVLGTLPGAEVRLSERKSVAVSYPAFFSDLRRVGGTARRRD